MYVIWAKYISLVLLISLSLYSGYSYILNIGISRGTKVAEDKYTSIIAEYKKLQDTKIDLVLLSMGNLTKATDTFNASNTLGMNSIISTLKDSKRPVVVYSKDTGCTLSEEFLGSRAKAIDIANQR